MDDLPFEDQESVTRRRARAARRLRSWRRAPAARCKPSGECRCAGRRRARAVGVRGPASTSAEGAPAPHTHHHHGGETSDAKIEPSGSPSSDGGCDASGPAPAWTRSRVSWGAQARTVDTSEGPVGSVSPAPPRRADGRACGAGMHSSNNRACARSTASSHRAGRTCAGGPAAENPSLQAACRLPVPDRTGGRRQLWRLRLSFTSAAESRSAAYA